MRRTGDATRRERRGPHGCRKRRLAARVDPAHGIASGAERRYRYYLDALTVLEAVAEFPTRTPLAAVHLRLSAESLAL